MVSKNTARLIFNAYMEIENAEKMLKDIKEHLNENAELELKDSWNNQRTLELHIPLPRSSSGYSVRQLPFDVAVTVLKNHIDAMKKELIRLKSVCELELAVKEKEGE